MVKERLDRALATPDGMDLFPNVKLDDLIAFHSDHNPILLHCEPGQQKRRNYMFRFENCWLKVEGIKDVVQNGWRHARTMMSCSVLAHVWKNWKSGIECDIERQKRSWRDIRKLWKGFV